MMKEPSNPNNRAAYFPKEGSNPSTIAYTGPVDGFALNSDVVLYETVEEAEKACDKYNLERRGL